ncbi:hypothetical protein [Streptomyces sp. NPDC059010]|uniref:hypothetical protein n=1 Tax=Streptomyces sp. NPDC059010 TaxID=3346695 RepID=UPI0036A4D82B
MASAAEDNGVGSKAFSDGAVAADIGSAEELPPIEQPARARTARTLRLRTVVV